MNSIYQITICYAIVINVLALILFGIDKLKAKKHWWRIPEATLLLSAGMGGSVGALCGMYLFHHKTMHKKFVIGVPVILTMQLTLIIYLITKGV